MIVRVSVELRISDFSYYRVGHFLCADSRRVVAVCLHIVSNVFTLGYNFRDRVLKLYASAVLPMCRKSNTPLSIRATGLTLLSPLYFGALP